MPCRLGDSRTLCLTKTLWLALVFTSLRLFQPFIQETKAFWKKNQKSPRPSLARTLPVAKLPDTTTSLPSSSSRIAPVRLWFVFARHAQQSFKIFNQQKINQKVFIHTYACHSYLQIAWCGNDHCVLQKLWSWVMHALKIQLDGAPQLMISPIFWLSRA